MITRVCLISAAVCLLSAGIAGNAEAQSSTGSPDLRLFFSLSTPGARAIAMGRAFTGIADDATASVTNPAGLARLIRPQVYVEFKSSLYEQVGYRPGKFAVSFLGASTPWMGGATAFTYHEYYRTGGASGVTGQTYAGSVAVPLGRVRIGTTVGLSRLHSSGSSKSALTVTGGIILSPKDKVSIGFSGGGSTDKSVAPARFAAGLGIRPSSRWLIAFDAAGTFYDKINGASADLHLGGEYLLVSGNTRVFIRGGFYTSSLDDDPLTSDTTETGGTFGFGLAGRRGQIDVAYLTRKEVVVSVALRF